MGKRALGTGAHGKWHGTSHALKGSQMSEGRVEELCEVSMIFYCKSGAQPLQRIVARLQHSAPGKTALSLHPLFMTIALRMWAGLSLSSYGSYKMFSRFTTAVQMH